MNDRIRIHRNKIYHVFSRTLSQVQKNKTRSHKTHPESHQASSKSLTSTSSQILSKEFLKSLETSPSQTGTVQNFSIKKYQIPKIQKGSSSNPQFFHHRGPTDHLFVSFHQRPGWTAHCTPWGTLHERRLFGGICTLTSHLISHLHIFAAEEIQTSFHFLDVATPKLSSLLKRLYPGPWFLGVHVRFQGSWVVSPNLISFVGKNSINNHSTPCLWDSWALKSLASLRDVLETLKCWDKSSTTRLGYMKAHQSWGKLTHRHP